MSLFKDRKDEGFHCYCCSCCWHSNMAALSSACGCKAPCGGRSAGRPSRQPGMHSLTQNSLYDQVPTGAQL